MRHLARIRLNCPRLGHTVAGTAAAVVATAAAVAPMPAAVASRPAAPASLTVLTEGAASYLHWKSGVVDSFVVQQASDSSFRNDVVKRKVRGFATTYTPLGLTPGAQYWFRVKAVQDGAASRWSNKALFLATAKTSAVRALGYNTLQWKDDKPRAGGTPAKWSDRRGPQLKLIGNSKAAVVGIEEGGQCLYKIQGEMCHRQIDDLADGLSSDGYRLVNTWGVGGAKNKLTYSGVNILYKPGALTPFGDGSTWVLSPSDDPRYSAYQAFRTPAGAEFLFVVVHTVATSGATGDKIRGAQTRETVEKAEAYAAKIGVTSIIYVGDFNTYFGEYKVNDVSGRYMRQRGIQDGIAVARARSKARYDSNNQLFRKARHGHGSIDHVYATAGVGVKKWGELLNLKHGSFVGTIPSDHNPVYAKVLLPY